MDLDSFLLSLLVRVGVCLECRHEALDRTVDVVLIESALIHLDRFRPVSLRPRLKLRVRTLQDLILVSLTRLSLCFMSADSDLRDHKEMIKSEMIRV